MSESGLDARLGGACVWNVQGQGKGGPDVTWLDLVQRIGAWHGQSVTDDEADFILWEHSAFPCSSFDTNSRTGRRLLREGGTYVTLSFIIHPQQHVF